MLPQNKNQSVRDFQLPEFRSYICQIPAHRTNKKKNTVTGKTPDWVQLGKKQVIVSIICLFRVK